MFDVLNGRLDGLQDRIDGLHKDLSESVDRIALMYERNGKLERERDAALSAMWGLICVASNRENQSAEWRGVAMMNLDRIYQERQEHWNELDRLRASVSLQARDGH